MMGGRTPKEVERRKGKAQKAKGPKDGGQSSVGVEVAGEAELAENAEDKEEEQQG